MIRWTRMYDEHGERRWAPAHRVGRYERLGWVRADEASRPAPQIEDVEHERHHGLEFEVSERPDEADHTHTEEYL